MRKTIIFLFILLTPLVLAETKTTNVLHANDTATVYGKTITLLSTSFDGKIKASVDGVQGIIKPGVNKTTNINEMFIEISSFTYIDPETFDVILKLTVKYECGDDTCGSSEDSVICCTDCGCEGNLKCINNICLAEECVIEWDCDDNNPCTVDKCSDTSPRTCSNTPITECVNDDGCCLDNCNEGNDNDCAEEVEEIIEEKEEPQEAEPETEEIQEVKEPEKEAEKVLITEKEKGILIMAGVALLVIIVGFFIFKKK